MKSHLIVLSLALTALVACVPAATTVKRSPVQTTAALAQVMKSSYDPEHPEKMPLACLLARPQMMEDIAKTGTGQYLGVTGFHYQGTTAQALNLINANMVSTAVFEGYPFSRGQNRLEAVPESLKHENLNEIKLPATYPTPDGRCFFQHTHA